MELREEIGLGLKQARLDKHITQRGSRKIGNSADLLHTIRKRLSRIGLR